MKHILIFDESDALKVVHLQPDSQSETEGKTEYFAGGCIRYEQIQTSKNQFVEPIIIKPPFDDHIDVFDSAVLSNSVLLVYPKDSL